MNKALFKQCASHAMMRYATPRGMSEAEARELIAERVRVLKIEKLVGDLAQFEPLLSATGGNPKAIEITMGLLKYERRPLQQVVDDLYAARGELFDDLFMHAWTLLDEAARRVLLVMTFFPTSASREAVSATADVQGFAFDRVIGRRLHLVEGTGPIRRGVVRRRLSRS